MRKRLYSFILIMSILLYGCSAKDSVAEKIKDEIIILYTANVNCEGDSGVTYAGVAAYKKEMEQLYENVSLVDAGNYLSGELLGTLSNGGYSIEIMNNVGYDVAAVGKKELYYDCERIIGMQASMHFNLVSCNLVEKSSDESVFLPYKIVTYGEKSVAYVGVTAPTAYNIRTEKKYLDESGNIKFEFCQDENGKRLYDKVQQSVNQAREDGADYVIILSNLGENDWKEKWDIKQLIVHTTGIDAVIDGGTDSVVVNEEVDDKNGEKVILTEPGSKLSNIGKITISKDKISAELVSNYDKIDVKTSEVMTSIIYKYKKSAQNTIVDTDFPLIMKSDDGADYYIRCKETNLGDLCADAYRDIMGADIALVDAGAINSEISAGAITYENTQDVFPYNQNACMIKASGSKIVEALELGVSQYPEPNHSFLQVSGIRFEIDISKVPAIVSKGPNLEYISDNYRVQNIEVLNRHTGKYEPIDLEREYLVAMSDYMYKGLSGSFLMFQGCDPVLDEEMSDAELLMQYLTPFWGEKLPQKYESPDGDGRIKFLNN